MKLSIEAIPHFHLMSSRSIGSRDAQSPERTNGDFKKPKRMFSRRNSRENSLDNVVENQSSSGNNTTSLPASSNYNNRRRRSKSETSGFKSSQDAKPLPYSNLSGAMNVSTARVKEIYSATSTSQSHVPTPPSKKKHSRPNSPKDGIATSQRKISVGPPQSRLTPVKIQKAGGEEFGMSENYEIVETDKLDDMDVDEYVAAVKNYKEIKKQEEAAKNSGQNSNTLSNSGRITFVEPLDENFLMANIANLAWELKACRQLLTVQSYMGNDLNVDSVVVKIMDSAHYILNCDRVSLYLVNHEAGTLRCVHSRDDMVGVVIPIGTGIAGQVAKTGQPINITDAYKDSRFYPEVDKQTGYRTKGVLCAPILNSTDPTQVEAVIQAINKKAPVSTINNQVKKQTNDYGRRVSFNDQFFSFTKTDESMLAHMAIEAGICLRNARMLENQRKQAQTSSMMTKLLTSFTVSLDTAKAVETIIECATDILDADRVSLFIFDAQTDELVCNVSKDVKGFRVPSDSGVVGRIMESGSILNVQSAYDYDYFNPEVDKKSGYKTKNILGGPVMDSKNNTIAVLQAVNKRSKEFFDAQDEELLLGITAQAGIALQNSQLYEDEKHARALNTSLLDVAKAVSSDLDTHALFTTIMEHARVLLHADRCSLFLIDYETEEFWSFVTDSEIEFRFPVTKGIVGEVAKTRKALNIKDAYKSDWFNAEIDAQSGYRTKSILCLPVLTSNDHMVGVIEMINKLDENGDLMTFSAEDETVLANFTDVVSGALGNSLIYKDLETHTSMVESTLEGISSYIITLDKDGRLKSCNHDIVDLFGAEDSVMRSSSFTNWIKDEKNSLFRENIQSVFNTRETVNVKNASILLTSTKGDRTITVNYSIMPLKVDGKSDRTKRRSSLLTSRTSRLGSKTGSEFNCSASESDIGANDSVSVPSSPISALLRKKENSDSPKKVNGSGGEKEKERELLNDDSHASLEKEKCQGVVIVLENITEERIRQSAIQRYQKRLNEMESQVQDYAELRNKLQSLEIDDLEDIKPETTRALANLALCVNDPIYSASGGTNQKIHNPVKRKASVDEDTLFKSGSPSSIGFLMEHKGVLSAKALKSWDWNALNVEDDAVVGKALITMFEELNLIDQWAIGMHTLENLISEVNAYYRDVPFHNFRHGVTVAHMSFYFIACTEAGTCLSAIQALSLMISALCHDLDHPGHTNAFEVNSGSELALLYNDTSVLENHHCATASRLMRKDDCNILAGLTKDEHKEFRSVMCKSILATDMATHFNLLSKFREAVHSEGGFSPQQNADQQLLISVLLHAADLSNPTREWETSKMWASLVSIEFNAQVEAEKEMKLPFLPFMSTDTDESKAKQESSFIEFIIEPMWKDVVEFLPQLNFCLENVATNKANWKQFIRKSNPGSISQSSSKKSLGSASDKSFKSKGSNDGKGERDLGGGHAKPIDIGSLKGSGGEETRTTLDDDDLGFAGGDDMDI